MDDQEKSNEEENKVEVNDFNKPEVENSAESMGEDSDTSNNNVDSVESMEAAPVEENGPISYPEQPAVTEVQPETPVMMATPVTPSEVIGVDKKKKPRSHIFKVIMVIFVVWLVVAAPIAAYLWRDRVAYDTEQAKIIEINNLNTEITNLKSELASEIAKNTGACAEVTPGVSVIDNIKASITSGNTQALEGYMASGVDVIIAATEGIGESTPTEAVSNITSFIGDTSVTWDFALTSAVLDSYRDGDYDQYFPATAVVGKASNGKVISFSFDCSAKIGTVFIVSSDELL